MISDLIECTMIISSQFSEGVEFLDLMLMYDHNPITTTKCMWPMCNNKDCSILEACRHDLVYQLF